MSNNSKPLVSIIIPTYNRVATIVEAVESVLSQSWDSREIIVVDDGSTDSTEEVLRPYQDRIRYLRRANGGFAAARNTGREAAQGTFIAWLDSDDVWLPDKLEMQVNFMMRHPEVVVSSTDFSEWRNGQVLQKSHIADYYAGIARQTGGVRGFYHVSEWVDRQGMITNTAGYWTGKGTIYQALIWGNFVHPPTAMFQRAAMEAVGFQDENLSNNSDFDYFLRLSRLGSFGYIDRPLLLYRYSEDQFSGPKYSLSMWVSLIKIMQRIEKDDPSAINGRESEFKKRIGSMHLRLAEIQAEERRYEFIGSLCRGLVLRPSIKEGFMVLVKAIIPSRLLQLLRKFLKFITGDKVCGT